MVRSGWGVGIPVVVCTMHARTLTVVLMGTMVASAAAADAGSYRDFYQPAGWPVLLTDDGLPRQYDGPPIDRLVVDAQVVDNDVSLLLFQMNAFPTGGYSTTPYLVQHGSTFTFYADSSSPPPGSIVTHAFQNLLAEVPVEDLSPGEYQLNGRFFLNGSLVDGGVTNFTIGLATLGKTGDYDGSGYVDYGDYQYWKKSFGSRTDLSADGNGNNQVDLGDYTIWRNAMADSADSAVSAIPEPTTSALWVIVLIALITRRHSLAIHSM